MAHKAVFVDRDRTLIEDPGYLSDPDAVKLLPGVDLALKSLAQTGYKIVVVTNQSGIARGLITEQQLEKIHAELRRQLAERNAHVDAIYFCPFHPEGTVEKYAIDSDLRKPKPGMLLKAAVDIDIDLASSWMVGDSARDVEAGQRAGCRTIRIRGAAQRQAGEISDDESVQADFTVRNLVDAARIIMRGGSMPGQAAAAVRPAAAPEVVQAAETKPAERELSDSEIRQEILRYVRQMARTQQAEEFSFTKLLGAIVQFFAPLALVWAVVKTVSDQLQAATVWALFAVCLQLMALTFFSLRRDK